MGFTEEQARDTLQNNNEDVEKAISYLVVGS